MGLFNDPRGAADAAADALSGAAHSVADAVGGAVEAAGNAVESALARIGGAVPRWSGAVAGSAFRLGATVLRAAFDLAGDVAGGLIRIAGGLLSRDLHLAARGLGDIGAGTMGAAIAVAGTAAAAVQTATGLQPRGRTLTAREEAVLAAIYRRSVDLRLVRIVEGRAGLFSLNARPFTLGNQIYMKSKSLPENMRTLVHECCHVWQHQNVGLRYIGDALWAQWSYAAAGGNAYDWRAELARTPRWREFNAEAQAAFVDTLWARGIRSGAAPARPGDFYDSEPLAADAFFLDPAHSGFARASVEWLRSR